MSSAGHGKKLRFHLLGINLKQEHKPHFKEVTLEETGGRKVTALSKQQMMKAMIKKRDREKTQKDVTQRLIRYVRAEGEEASLTHRLTISATR